MDTINPKLDGFVLTMCMHEWNYLHMNLSSNISKLRVKRAQELK